MINFLKKIWNFILAFWPLAVKLYIIFFLCIGISNIRTELRNDVKVLKAQNNELYQNQVNVYNAMIQAQAASLIIDEQLVEGLAKAKADTVASNNEIMKILYQIDQNSLARDEAIIKGVTTELQRPTYKYLRSVTVFIEAVSKVDQKHGWIGTGVIVKTISNTTYILTNRHVMDNDLEHYDYYVFEGQEKYPLINIKLSKDEKVDLSLNKVESIIPGKQAVTGISDIQPQERVYMVGQNLGRPFLYGEGFVAGFDPSENFELVIGVPSGPGNSGSGVINKDGKLVGLLYAGSIIQEGLLYTMDTAHGLCINSQILRLFLAGYLD